LDEWFKTLDQQGNFDKIIKFVIGNKSDVEKDERRIEMR